MLHRFRRFVIPRIVARTLAACTLAACGGVAGPSDARTSDAPVRWTGDAPIAWDAQDAASSDATDVPTATWGCPPDWVSYERGGCGLAAVLCAPDGGAVPGACADASATGPHSVTAGDAGARPGFYAQGDGGLGGGWGAPSVPSDGGTMVCPPGWSVGPTECGPVVRGDCGANAGPLPDGTCTDAHETPCPATTWVDVSAASGGATVVYVLAGSDPVLADGTRTHPDVSIRAGIARAGANGWVVVGAGTYVEGLTVSAPIHVVGACAEQVAISLPASDTRPLVTVSGARGDFRGVRFDGGSTGVRVDTGGALELRSVRFEALALDAVYVTGVGSTAHVANAWFHDVRGPAPAFPGRAVRADAGASVTIEATSITGENGGLVASGTGTSLTWNDGTLLGARARGDGLLPAAVTVVDGAQATLQRGVVGDVSGAGVGVAGSGTVVTLADLRVHDTLPADLTSLGFGVLVRDSARVTAARVVVTRARATGIGATGAGTVATLEDCAVFETQPDLSGTAGFGLAASDRAVVNAQRVLVDRATEGGIHADSARIYLADGWIQRTRTSVRGLGYGVGIASTAELFAQRLTVQGTHGFGVAVAGDDRALPTVGGTLRIDDLFERAVALGTVRLGRDGAAPPGSETTVAYGLSAGPGSAAIVTHFVLADGDLGFVTSARAALSFGLVTGQHRAGAAANGSPDAQPMLDHVTLLGNTDNTVTIDSALPSALGVVP